MVATADTRQHLEVETPEHVVLDYEIAGLGSRALAAIVDTAIIFVLLVAVTLLTLYLSLTWTPLARAFGVALAFSFLWGYFTLFEGLRRGQTPGKRLLGIRVIRDTGHGITMRESAARNLVRFADFLPPPYLLGGLFVAIHPKARRLGDLVAGTVVVRDRPLEQQARPAAQRRTAAVSGALGAPILSDDEFRVLREFLARASALEAPIRERFAASLVSRFASRVPERHVDGMEFLETLFASEGERRQGSFGGRVTGSRTTTASSNRIAERLVAQKDARWREFDALATRVARQGLDSLAAPELPEFATRYREVAADLARVQTYGGDSTLRTRLERLVAAGHNALYRRRASTLQDVSRFLLLELPSAVIAARRVVLVAFLAFAIPAAVGYATIRERPALADEVLPASLLDRAAEGANEVRAGRGYAEAKAGDRPLMASAITTNNIQVAFVCFAGGIFLAVGSLLALAFNGLLLGGTSAHYHNVGLLGYLWTFVAGHGVLELFAIWCAGAAGFLLGSAIVRPGAYARRDALVINGRVSVRLIGFAVVLLLFAGAIEGFLSASGEPVEVKVGVSVLSAVLLAAYLWMGTRRVDEGANAPPPELAR